MYASLACRFTWLGFWPTGADCGCLVDTWGRVPTSGLTLMLETCTSGLYDAPWSFPRTLPHQILVAAYCLSLMYKPKHMQFIVDPKPKHSVVWSKAQAQCIVDPKPKHSVLCGFKAQSIVDPKPKHSVLWIQSASTVYCGSKAQAQFSVDPRPKHSVLWIQRPSTMYCGSEAQAQCIVDPKPKHSVLWIQNPSTVYCGLIQSPSTVYCGSKT